MSKLYSRIGVTGLNVLVVLGLVWLSRPAPHPAAPPSVPFVGPPATPVTPLPVVHENATTPATEPPADLTAVKDELASLEHQQRQAFAALQQQQHNTLAALQQRLERLFTAHQALAQQFEALARQAADEADTESTPDDNKGTSAEDTVVQVARTHEAQAVDRAWSTQATTAIEQKFAGFNPALPGAVLLDTECRSTVCRMAVAFESAESREAILQLLPHVIPWSAQGLLHVDAETQTVLFYAAREGESLDTAR